MRQARILPARSIRPSRCSGLCRLIVAAASWILEICSASSALALPYRHTAVANVAQSLDWPSWSGPFWWYGNSDFSKQRMFGCGGGTHRGCCRSNLVKLFLEDGRCRCKAVPLGGSTLRLQNREALRMAKCVQSDAVRLPLLDSTGEFRHGTQKHSRSKMVLRQSNRLLGCCGLARSRFIQSGRTGENHLGAAILERRPTVYKIR